MAFTDQLKSFRNKGYIDKKKTGMDSGDKNETSRIIKLSDDEQKAFAQSNPGEDLACEVHGTLESDGHFHVMTVAPIGGSEDYGDKDMPDEVAQRVMPGIGRA